MDSLATAASDAELIEYVDRWCSLLEAEDYDAAYHHTDHNADMNWTPTLIREVIKSYDEALPTQKVTLKGKAIDITQRKEVDRWQANSAGAIGEVWYDLNIDGVVSDLTATFTIMQRTDGLTLELNDIHVM